MEDEIMTVKEVSEYLKLSVVTVYKLLNNGAIPGFRIGSSWRVIQADLDSM